MLIGEQPGDQEESQREPLRRPAGHVLDEALDGAGCTATRSTSPNVVKHFKWTAAREAAHPSEAESRRVAACRPAGGPKSPLVQPHVVALSVRRRASGHGPRVPRHDRARQVAPSPVRSRGSSPPCTPRRSCGRRLRRIGTRRWTRSSRSSRRCRMVDKSRLG